MTSFVLITVPRDISYNYSHFAHQETEGSLSNTRSRVMETGTEQRLSDSRDLRAYLECFKSANFLNQ